MNRGGDRAPPSPMKKISIKTRPGKNEKTSSITQETISPIPAETKPDPREMKEAVRFLSDYSELGDVLLDSLSSTNTNFNVISAIGPQGSGKSTILSMLAGNSSRNLYREYFFRPVSREANESSKHQTFKIDIFVANRLVFLDCQPMHSLSILEQTTRGNKGDDSSAIYDTQKLIAVLLMVSHTVLVCNEIYIDLNMIKTIRMAELMRAHLPDFSPKLSLDRKTNLVFIQTKAQSIDFLPYVLEEREKLLRAMFQDSRRLRVSELPGKVLFPLVEIKLTREQLIDGADCETNAEEDSLQEFDDTITKLRNYLLKNKDRFTESTGGIDERKWVHMCGEVMKDRVLASSLRLHQQMYLQTNND